MARKPIFLLYTALLISAKAPAQLHLRQAPALLPGKVDLRVLPQNFYTTHTGFVCKKEAQLQKALSLPLFFRLGSKEQVDWLERKPNSYVGKRD